MRITQWGEYGTLAMMFVSEQKSLGKSAVTANEVAKSLAIDIQYAHQILQKLRKGSLIESVRGPKGGYQLSKTQEEVTLYDIIKACEGETFEVICEHRPIKHPDCMVGAYCSLKVIWNELSVHIDVYLKSVTLAKLVSMNQEARSLSHK